MIAKPSWFSDVMVFVATLARPETLTTWSWTDPGATVSVCGPAEVLDEIAEFLVVAAGVVGVGFLLVDVAVASPGSGWSFTRALNTAGATEVGSRPSPSATVGSV